DGDDLLLAQLGLGRDLLHDGGLGHRLARAARLLVVRHWVPPHKSSWNGTPRNDMLRRVRGRGPLVNRILGGKPDFSQDFWRRPPGTPRNPARRGQCLLPAPPWTSGGGGSVEETRQAGQTAGLPARLAR